ncbi:MAG TPA: efflux RND transporter periplasmic adaptor subunit [Polyangiaceae bacterium]|nr:efflux RND transporter periplasmic adaptor subunit [Polyangiaceae bacterium]
MTPRRAGAAGALTLASLACSLAAVAAGGTGRAEATAPPPPLPAPARPPPAPAAPPDEFLGVVLARASADVAPRLGGRLRAVFVRPGDAVGAGDAIAALDAPAVGFELREAEAARDAADAERGRAAIELSEAGELLARRRALSDAALASGEELTDATYRRALAAARADAARAQLAERHARAERLRRDRDDTLLRAPFAGVVAARYADPGANVTPSTPVVRLISAGDLFVRFAVPEGRAAGLAVGRRVLVRAGEGAEPIGGAVDRIAPEIDAASRMLFAEADLPPGERGAPAGGLARVSLVPAPGAPTEVPDHGKRQPNLP